TAVTGTSRPGWKANRRSVERWAARASGDRRAVSRYRVMAWPRLVSGPEPPTAPPAPPAPGSDWERLSGATHPQRARPPVITGISPNGGRDRVPELCARIQRSDG